MSDEPDVSKLVAADRLVRDMAESAYHDGRYTIGSILDHMQTNWDREQQSQVNTAKKLRGKPHVWARFPRDQVRAELIKRWQHLNPQSPNNEANRFFARQMRNVMETQERAHAQNDPALYKMSGGRL